jgi:epoxyqueuosine reductase QueG
MKNVIVCVQEIPRGVFRGVEEGTLWQRAPRQITAHFMYELSRYLEDEGCLAVPCSPLSQDRWPEGIKFRKSNVEPNVYPSLEYAAIAAGLGEIGYSGLFLTPQFGLRQSLGMLITDLDIEGDELFSGRVCNASSCKECVKACPMGAVKGEQEVKILNKTFTTAKLDKNICNLCPNGAFPDTTCEASMPNRLTAACGRACLACLDAGGKLEKKYQSPFRRRPAWSIKLEEMK